MLLTPSVVVGIMTLERVRGAAHAIGCEIKTSAIGPAYRIELLADADANLPDTPQADGRLLGYSSGVALPNGVAHLESIQLRRYTGYWRRSRSAAALAPPTDRYAKVPRFRQHGLGLLLSVAVFCYIRECAPFGCSRAELLAIFDNPAQHRTLVRYYRRLGFAPLREVGDGVGSFVDLMAWGGTGLLMDVEVDAFLARHESAITSVLDAPSARELES